MSKKPRVYKVTLWYEAEDEHEVEVRFAPLTCSEECITWNCEETDALTEPGKSFNTHPKKTETKVKLNISNEELRKTMEKYYNSIEESLRPYRVSKGRTPDGSSYAIGDRVKLIDLDALETLENEEVLNSVAIGSSMESYFGKVVTIKRLYAVEPGTDELFGFSIEEDCKDGPSGIGYRWRIELIEGKIIYEDKEEKKNASD